MLMILGGPFHLPCFKILLLGSIPGGIVLIIMTITPMMGVAQNSLLKTGPFAMKVQLQDSAKVVYSLGLTFWGIFAFVLACGPCCYYRYCRCVPHQPASSQQDCLFS